MKAYGTKRVETPGRKLRGTSRGCPCCTYQRFHSKHLKHRARQDGKAIVLAAMVLMAACTVGHEQTEQDKLATQCVGAEYVSCQTEDGLAGYCSTKEQGERCYPQCDLVSCTNFQFVWPDGLEQPGICYCMREGMVVEQ